MKKKLFAQFIASCPVYKSTKALFFYQEMVDVLLDYLRNYEQKAHKLKEDAFQFERLIKQRKNGYKNFEYLLKSQLSHELELRERLLQQIKSHKALIAKEGHKIAQAIEKKAPRIREALDHLHELNLQIEGLKILLETELLNKQRLMVSQCIRVLQAEQHKMLALRQC